MKSSDFFLFKITNDLYHFKNMWFIDICLLQAIVSYIITFCSQLNSNYLHNCLHDR